MCVIPASRFSYRPSLPQAYKLPTMQANVLKVMLLVSTVQHWIYAKSSKKRRLLSFLKPQVAARTDLLIKKFTKKKLRKTRLLYCIHAYSSLLCSVCPLTIFVRTSEPLGQASKVGIPVSLEGDPFQIRIPPPTTTY